MQTIYGGEKNIIESTIFHIAAQFTEKIVRRLVTAVLQPDVRIHPKYTYLNPKLILPNHTNIPAESWLQQ